MARVLNRNPDAVVDIPVTMKPSEKYQQFLLQPDFSDDASQRQALGLLDELQQVIMQQLDYLESPWWRRFLNRGEPLSTPSGLYLWGGVGLGKTFLMDIFYLCLPADIRMREHFHQFMNQIHLELKLLGRETDPLHQIALSLARKTRVLCLDEFVITDIGDAMLMAGLLESLFAQGVVLVTTSNTAPKNLYAEGLQRARFQPAIELILRHCGVFELAGVQDYRLLGLAKTELYSVPHSARAVSIINQYLAEHVSASQSSSQQLSINGRDLDFQFCAEDTVWFSFEQLCRTTRSQKDYLELARLFNTLILTDITVMTSDTDDIARRFVLLVDILYDHHVILICSAQSSPEQLYQGSQLTFEFARTASRLIEMQSQQYLASAHTLQ